MSGVCLPSWRSLNRTIVELKLESEVMITSTSLTLNRTIVELKYEHDTALSKGVFSLNRTIVELK